MIGDGHHDPLIMMPIPGGVSGVIIISLCHDCVALR
jgi:hypothetical protein